MAKAPQASRKKRVVSDEVNVTTGVRTINYGGDGLQDLVVTHINQARNLTKLVENQERAQLDPGEPA